ncbi:hypothetical protein E1B22_12575 (plasmid) [Thermaerobacter sp. FW80]|uniref:hypothetical protein n=1 Tax=Thermaerobacter sp. FW80 TaxID=2546351 RepID=UPI0010758BF3|nr:hypothetical protein [Thermaerobacter sp. FW80]QBS38741.1 hypothetical protein E1B22_12575 [Thermaerobacter sp. FW80]
MKRLLNRRKMVELRKRLKAAAMQAVAVMEQGMAQAARVRNDKELARVYTPEALEELAQQRIAAARREAERILTRASLDGEPYPVRDLARFAHEAAEKAVAERDWLNDYRYERVVSQLAPVVTGQPLMKLFELYRRRAGDPEAKAYLEEVIQARIDVEGGNRDTQELFEALKVEANKLAAEPEREAREVLELARRRAEYAEFIGHFLDAAERAAQNGARAINEDGATHHYALLLTHWFDREEQGEQPESEPAAEPEAVAE